MKKIGCIAALLLAGMGVILWPEPEAPLRTDVEPLQRRLVLDGGISSAQWRARPAMEYGWGPPVQDNYFIITGLLEVPAAAELFGAAEDDRPVVANFEGSELELVESASVLAHVCEQMTTQRDKALKPCRLMRFAWCRQLNRVYIELECP